MKLEDLLSSQPSFQSQNEVQALSSSSTEAVQLSKELDIKVLYDLIKQVKRIIERVESGQTFKGSLKFLGVSFNIFVSGLELPDKGKVFQSFLFNDEDKTECFEDVIKENVQLRKQVALNDEIMKRFCFSFEDSMKSQYFNYLFTGEFKQRKSIVEKKVFDSKSWALLQANYKKMKDYNENCEKISRTLEWHKTEVQFLKVELQDKMRDTLKKEGELSFRQEEINKMQSEYQENVKALESRQQALITGEINLENYKKKLEKMKGAIRAQLQELQKINSMNNSAKKTTNTSKFTEVPSFKKFTFGSNFNSETGDSELEDPNLPELSIEAIPPRTPYERPHQHPSRPSDFFNKPTVKSSQTPRAAEKDPVHLSIPSTPRENLSNSDKPPISSRRYLKNFESSSQGDSLSLREERLAEREAEIERREKEIQKNWLKNPTAQEFIPMIQNEMMRLKTLQREYDKKVKVMQDRINKSENFEEKFMSKFSRNPSQSMRDEQSSILSSDESIVLSSKVDKLKDLCTMMEELLV